MAPARDPRTTATAADEAQPAPRRRGLAAAWTNFTENFFSTVFVGLVVGVAMFGLGVVNDNFNARFAAIDARLDKLEENQLEMALTLTRLVTLLEARGDAESAPADSG